MNDLENHNNESFEALLNESFVTLRSGEIVKGTVINVTDTEVMVNLGYKSDGIISKAEFSNDPHINLKNAVKVGDEIEVYILRVNDGEGIIELSKKRVDIQKGWDILQKAYEAESILTGRVVEAVKGGIIVLNHEVRIFIPASLLGARYIQDLNQFLGQTIHFKIVEFDKKRRKIIGDRKQVLVEERKIKREQLLNSLEVGDLVTGRVSNITGFGAFVDLGGIDGLIHSSELSWKRISKPSDILKIGQEVKARVIQIDKENEKISLSLKKEEENPWTNVEQKYPVGSVVKGKVVRMVPFGAFVELEDGLDGLIHISQIANKHVANAEEELQLGQIIEAKVMEVDEKQKKISLSIKEIKKETEQDNEKENELSQE
ncbi:MAG TPA: 30S ribosomal protein S1 [Defluviitaleaceae bacterium]|jgi:small subunit ribosomal protein S1|nr:30S ribosomal protein S1 [Candidatus Epulonipiscium sp.]HPT75415.1 30S ribosomal protein S1 [Defluviitaleaceae bacterium]HQD50251.1 30S ribosomal protein S1 [Defluviitaleaceae bacterium]